MFDWLQHGLTNEEMRPYVPRVGVSSAGLPLYLREPACARSYVARVMAAPANWMVHSTALLVKCWLEFEGTRTRERATLQVPAHVDAHLRGRPPCDVLRPECGRSCSPSWTSTRRASRRCSSGRPSLTRPHPRASACGASVVGVGLDVPRRCRNFFGRGRGRASDDAYFSVSCMPARACAGGP